jgi:hypothetical protein
MTTCQLDFIGFDKVAGMGQIPAASRARDYAPLTGLEPELQVDQPAWMVQFAGEVPQAFSGETWIDPICVEVDGKAGFYATGPVRTAAGALHTPRPVPIQPKYSLPSLMP